MISTTADEEEMYLLSAYHRAKDFLEGRITMATFSGSWECGVEEVEQVLGSVGETRRSLPAGVPDTAEMREVLRDWLVGKTSNLHKRLRLDHYYSLSSSWL